MARVRKAVSTLASSEGAKKKSAPVAKKAAKKSGGKGAKDKDGEEAGANQAGPKKGSREADGSFRPGGGICRSETNVPHCTHRFVEPPHHRLTNLWSAVEATLASPSFWRPLRAPLPLY